MQNFLKITEGMDINGGLAVRAFSATASTFGGYTLAQIAAALVAAGVLA